MIHIDGAALSNEFVRFLETTPKWEKLNAYERTKHCCAELTKRGERIPSWIVIRNLIGKGSSNDINRGKNDFRQEHGLTLRNMTGFADGTPNDVAAQVNNLLATAANHAHAGFEEQAKKLQQQIDLAELTITCVKNERDQALTNVNRLNNEIAELKNISDILKANAACERLAREHAVRLLETNQQEISNQRERLIAVLDNSQKELKDALSRLEGAENHVLMEIGRIRADTQKKFEALETRHDKEIRAKEASIKSLENKLQAQLAFENETLQKAKMFEQENRGLHDQLQHAEALADKLSAVNAQLAATIRQLSGNQ
jgi:DNA repair exonuclease SbcCD ATPase subunit